MRQVCKSNKRETTRLCRSRAGGSEFYMCFVSATCFQPYLANIFQFDESFQIGWTLKSPSDVSDLPESFALHLYTCEFVSFIDYAVCRSSIPVSNVTQNSKGTCCLRFFWWSAENSRLCMFRMCFVITCIVSDLMSLRRLPVLQHFGLFHGNSRSVPVLCVGGELRAARWSLMCWPSEEHKKS